MRELKPWEVISRKTVIDCRWLRVDEGIYRQQNGALIQPFYSEYRPDFAVICAFDGKMSLLTVRQYRMGIGRVLTEMPAGMIEEGEDPLSAAHRELREETGYEAEGWRHLFDLTINAAYSDNKAHCFLAEGLRKVAGQRLDETESLDYRWMPIDEVMENLHNGGFGNGFNAAAIYRSLEILRRKD
jgi:ADP-ribose pyrophosphatase